jgi:UPF0716 family protein affecting phage T7 exclusion
MIVYFIVYLFAEVMISTEFAAHFGGVIFFLEILVSFLVGVALMVNFKYAIVEQLNNFAFGKIAPEDLISVGVFTLLGAILLIIPGVLSDILGLMMQFEWFALLLKKVLFRSKFPTNQNQPRGKDDYIDVEVIDDVKDSTDPDALKR